MELKTPGKVNPGHTISVMGFAAGKLIGLRLSAFQGNWFHPKGGGEAELSSIIMGCMWVHSFKHILTEFELDLNERRGKLTENISRLGRVAKRIYKYVTNL